MLASLAHFIIRTKRNPVLQKTVPALRSSEGLWDSDGMVVVWRGLKQDYSFDCRARENVNYFKMKLEAGVWSDYQLRWDEADYGGINVLRLPQIKFGSLTSSFFNKSFRNPSQPRERETESKIQLPNTRGSVCADGNYEVRYKSNVLIYPEGQVMWVPPAIYQSSCTIDVTYFPFDQQKCVMKFGSWTFNGDQVSLKLYNDNYWVDLSDYWKSGTWDIVEVPAFLNINNHQSDPADGAHFLPLYPGLLSARRGWRKSDPWHLDPAFAGRFPAPSVEDLATDFAGTSAHRQVPAVHLPHEHGVHPGHRDHPQLELPGARTHRMPNWIRVVFLKYLPIMLFMKRPKKTRLRWMMEMPGVGTHHHYHGSPDLKTSATCHTVKGTGVKMDFVEMADIHHPNCTAARNPQQVGEPQLRDIEGAETLYLTPEAFRATEAIEFIAEHLRSEDEYIQVRLPFQIAWPSSAASNNPQNTLEENWISFACINPEGRNKESLFCQRGNREHLRGRHPRWDRSVKHSDFLHSSWPDGNDFHLLLQYSSQFLTRGDVIPSRDASPTLFTLKRAFSSPSSVSVSFNLYFFPLGFLVSSSCLLLLIFSDDLRVIYFHEYTPGSSSSACLE
ncbi:acetylcholine receptor subunit beta-like 1 [Caerostris extrusa]|uniref:Acetylcholine receptor subunit beta-like 1 n=1 Tax=Caerostris extrusa TaxID=172846 RepID=A0AAV4XAI9_CAEEX|nr:acetylcholine receptor subunit beta-like 1 [Caerostris extrusa]